MQFVDHAPKREHVGAVVDRQPACLLGRHVAHRPHHQARRGIRGRRGIVGGRRGAGQSEIEHLDVPVARHDDVCRLQVAMDDAAVVRGGESPGDLRAVLDRFANRHRSARGDLSQRVAFEELGHGVRGLAFAADVVDGNDVGMRKGGERFHLALEPRERLGIAREGCRQDFDRDLASEPRVPRSINLAHAAGANGGDDLVGAESGSRAERHYSR